MMYRLFTAASVLLALAGFLILAADARTDDPPPAKQKNSKAETDDPMPPTQKGAKTNPDDPPPAKLKGDEDKSDGPPPGSGRPPVPGDGQSGSPKGDEDKTDDPPPPPSPEGVEVQTRGPVHEAFAEPAGSQPVATPVIPKAPPAPIAEQAPNQKPQGQNSVWIPGYWSFDDEKKDYVWVSGLWRVPPPGRVWMPGHWQSVRGGSQWVAGFWSLANQAHVEYLPPPPPPVDTAPSPAPQPGMDYAPGCWVYSGARYLWRPGFWHPHCPGWIWIPATYVWTPAGCVYVEGYWDHPLQLRGLLFAPVVFDPAVIASRSFRYTPAFAVNTEFLTCALFARPSCRAYYFGDYFGPTYSRAGYIAWCDYRAHRFAPDPLFDYYRVAGGLGRHDAGWSQNMRQLYAGRANGSIPRPPRTLAAQTQATRNLASNRATPVNKEVAANTRTNMTAVTHLSRMTGNPAAANSVRLERLSAAHSAEVQKTTTQYRDVARERRQGEARLWEHYAGPPHDSPTHPGTSRPTTGAVPAHATQARPATGTSATHMVTPRTLPLRLPHEIVKASTAPAATSAKPNGAAARTRPPQPTMPKPQPHTDAGRPAATGKP
jgi:hypothetical protein